MACTNLLTADIINDCSKPPVKGLKPKAWIFNRAEIASLTKTTNTISAITRVSGKTSFTAEGFSDFMNAGYEAVVTDGLPTTFNHSFSIKTWAATAAEKANLDKADDIVVIVQKNGLQEEGCFLAYGVTNGLWKKSQTKKANDNSGTTEIEFSTKEGQGEEYSEYVFWNTNFATTLAALVATETV